MKNKSKVKLISNNYLLQQLNVNKKKTSIKMNNFQGYDIVLPVKDRLFHKK